MSDPSVRIYCEKFSVTLLSPIGIITDANSLSKIIKSNQINWIVDETLNWLWINRIILYINRILKRNLIFSYLTDYIWHEKWRSLRVTWKKWNQLFKACSLIPINIELTNIKNVKGQYEINRYYQWQSCLPKYWIS